MEERVIDWQQLRKAMQERLDSLEAKPMISDDDLDSISTGLATEIDGWIRDYARTGGCDQNIARDRIDVILNWVRDLARGVDDIRADVNSVKSRLIVIDNRYKALIRGRCSSLDPFASSESIRNSRSRPDEELVSHEDMKKEFC